MKLYQIYTKGSYNSGGFSEFFDEPMSGLSSKTIFTTYDKAKLNLPKQHGDRFTGFTDYYIKEIEIE